MSENSQKNSKINEESLLKSLGSDSYSLNEEEVEQIGKGFQYDFRTSKSKKRIVNKILHKQKGGSSDSISNSNRYQMQFVEKKFQNQNNLNNKNQYSQQKNNKINNKKGNLQKQEIIEKKVPVAQITQNVQNNVQNTFQTQKVEFKQSSIEFLNEISKKILKQEEIEKRKQQGLIISQQDQNFNQIAQKLINTDNLAKENNSAQKIMNNNNYQITVSDFNLMGIYTDIQKANLTHTEQKGLKQNQNETQIEKDNFTDFKQKLKENVQNFLDNSKQQQFQRDIQQLDLQKQGNQQQMSQKLEEKNKESLLNKDNKDQIMTESQLSKKRSFQQLQSQNNLEGGTNIISAPQIKQNSEFKFKENIYDRFKKDSKQRQSIIESQQKSQIDKDLKKAEEAILSKVKVITPLKNLKIEDSSQIDFDSLYSQLNRVDKDEQEQKNLGIILIQEKELENDQQIFQRKLQQQALEIKNQEQIDQNQNNNANVVKKDDQNIEIQQSLFKDPQFLQNINSYFQELHNKQLVTQKHQEMMEKLQLAEQNLYVFNTQELSELTVFSNPQFLTIKNQLAHIPDPNEQICNQINASDKQIKEYFIPVQNCMFDSKNYKSVLQKYNNNEFKVFRKEHQLKSGIVDYDEQITRLAFSTDQVDKFMDEKSNLEEVLDFIGFNIVLDTRELGYEEEIKMKAKLKLICTELLNLNKQIKVYQRETAKSLKIKEFPRKQICSHLFPAILIRSFDNILISIIFASDDFEQLVTQDVESYMKVFTTNYEIFSRRFMRLYKQGEKEYNDMKFFDKLRFLPTSDPQMSRILRGIINTNGFDETDHQTYLEEMANNYRKILTEFNQFEMEKFRQISIINNCRTPQMLNTLKAINELSKFSKAKIEILEELQTWSKIYQKYPIEENNFHKRENFKLIYKGIADTYFNQNAFDFSYPGCNIVQAFPLQKLLDKDIQGLVEFQIGQLSRNWFKQLTDQKHYQENICISCGIIKIQDQKSQTIISNIEQNLHQNYVSRQKFLSLHAIISNCPRCLISSQDKQLVQNYDHLRNKSFQWMFGNLTIENFKDLIDDPLDLEYYNIHYNSAINNPKAAMNAFKIAYSHYLPSIRWLQWYLDITEYNLYSFQKLLEFKEQIRIIHLNLGETIKKPISQSQLQFLGNKNRSAAKQKKEQDKQNKDIEYQTNQDGSIKLDKNGEPKKKNKTYKQKVERREKIKQEIIQNSKLEFNKAKQILQSGYLMSSKVLQNGITYFRTSPYIFVDSINNFNMNVLYKQLTYNQQQLKSKRSTSNAFLILLLLRLKYTQKISFFDNMKLAQTINQSDLHNQKIWIVTDADNEQKFNEFLLPNQELQPYLNTSNIEERIMFSNQLLYSICEKKLTASFVNEFLNNDYKLTFKQQQKIRNQLQNTNCQNYDIFINSKLIGKSIKQIKEDQAEIPIIHKEIYLYMGMELPYALISNPIYYYNHVREQFTEGIHFITINESMKKKGKDQLFSTKNHFVEHYIELLGIDLKSTEAYYRLLEIVEDKNGVFNRNKNNNKKIKEERIDPLKLLFFEVQLNEEKFLFLYEFDLDKYDFLQEEYQQQKERNKPISKKKNQKKKNYIVDSESEQDSELEEIEDIQNNQQNIFQYDLKSIKSQTSEHQYETALLKTLRLEF